jgi:serine/threonine protein kinase
MTPENQLIGNYLVLQEKNGIVVARDTRTDWLEQLVKLPNRWRGQKAAFQSLVQDLQGVMSLQNENAQIVDDAFEHKHAYYLALRFVEAAPLEKILRELKALSIDEVKRLANQVGGALISAHGLGVVHGNLEIKNLMVNKDGDYILAGFTDLPLSRYNKTTLKYKAGSAPELLAGEQVSFASDQYSLAKLLKNLVERAKKATDFKKSDLSQGMIDSLNKALNKDPNERYRDVNAFMRAFNGGAQANKNSTNAARNQASRNARKQDRPMNLSEIPPSYLPSGSMTSGAESALSQAISSSANNSGFYEGTGIMPVGNAEISDSGQPNAQNPYAMWSGVSPIEAQSQADTMRVGAGKPPIVVEDFEIGPAKSSNVEKDLSMRNIPKYKPAFDVDLSDTAPKSADVPFALDDEASTATPHKDRMRTFVLALGMVMIILVAVTVALLGGNSPIIKLPGSKDVSANLEFNGVMQSTLAKGAFPTGTPNLISIVPIATQFPGLQTEVYDGIGGGLNLSPTPTATVTQTPSPTVVQTATATPELEVPGAYATAPANSGMYWDITIQENSQTTQEPSNLDAVGGQGSEIYWGVQMETPAAETASPTLMQETAVPTPNSSDYALVAPNSEPVPTEWSPVAPSPEPFYWDIMIDFPKPQEVVTPAIETPAPETPLPTPTSSVINSVETHVSSSTAKPAGEVSTDTASQNNQGGSPAEFVLPTLVAPRPTPIPEPFYWDIVIDFPKPQEVVTPAIETPAPQPADQTEIAGANLQTQVASLLSVPTATPEAPLPTPTSSVINSVEAHVSSSTSKPAGEVSTDIASQNNQGGSPAEFVLPALVAPRPTPIPMLAGSEGSGSDVRVVADSKPNLVVTVVDGLGRPVVDREVMVLPANKASLPAIDTPLLINPTPEFVVPMLAFMGGPQADLGGRIGRTDAFGQIHFDLDPGSFQVVYVPSGRVTDSDSMAHYQVEVAVGSKTELTLHRELVTINFLNVEGEKVDIAGLALVRVDQQNRGGSQDRKPAIIRLAPEPAANPPEGSNLQGAEPANGGAEPGSFPILDLTPGEFELVQLNQSGQDYKPLGVKVSIPQGQADAVEIQLGRLVLPASFLEQQGQAGDTLQVILQSTANSAPSQTSDSISSLTYQGEAVVKIDLLPGTYSIDWAGTRVENITIRPGEASDVYVGPQGGK